MPSSEAASTGADRFATCGDRRLLIDWHINRHFFYTFEVDVEEAERIVPERLAVLEIRPGIALLGVGVLRFEPGAFGAGSPTFLEVWAGIHVAPDLSTPMPMPMMTLFSFAVLTDSPEFVAPEAHTLYARARLGPSLTLELTADQLGGRVADEEGPILDMPSAHPAPSWVHKEMWGQHFTDTRGLQHGIWEWDGRLYTHMRQLPGWRLFDHPFWAGLDVGRVQRCYRTMVQEPGTICRERFYEMRPVGGTRA